MSFYVELNNVSVKYGDSLILEDINLRVAENEFLGIIGPNGGGKTTLLKVLSGLIKPKSGSVTIGGKKIETQKSLVGYVPQFTSFNNDFPINVLEVVKMGRLGKMGNENDDQILKCLETMQILNLRDEQIGNLSGGQKQRVLIARALVGGPKILLLDEPTASIDSKTGKSVYELLNKLNETTTIILVSHDIGAISRHVKKIGCLNKKLVYHDTKEITKEMLESTYQCPVDLIAHGIPHRVLEHHHQSI
ncbi:MAG: ABC transporter ATP-binding protein [Melioribacteraceae bacterium]|nr:ABC transporter ATP-binding protein [Melioribacteraceae bacterium]